MSRIREAEAPYYRTDLPDISIGDSVRVHVKIQEGGKERIQVFQGTVIKIRGGGLGQTFTVRRIVQGEGVERIFPFHAPVVDKVEVTRHGRVRRAKLYYLRDRVGKSTRLPEVLGRHRKRRKGANDPAHLAARYAEQQAASAETEASEADAE